MLLHKSCSLHLHNWKCPLLNGPPIPLFQAANIEVKIYLDAKQRGKQHCKDWCKIKHSYFIQHYAPETFRMRSLGLTLLKFVDFTPTAILREIKVWWIQTVQKVIFGNFRYSELLILVNFGLESCSNLLKIKIQSLWSCHKWHFLTVWIRQNLISHKIGVAIRLSNFNKVMP